MNDYAVALFRLEEIRAMVAAGTACEVALRIYERHAAAVLALPPARK